MSAYPLYVINVNKEIKIRLHLQFMKHGQDKLVQPFRVVYDPNCAF